MEVQEIYTTYCIKILEKDSPKEFYDTFKEIIDKMTPFLLFETMSQLQHKYQNKELLQAVGKFINAFSKGLLNYPLGPTPKGGFLYLLREENYQLQDKITELKTLMKRQNFVEDKDLYLKLLNEFAKYDSHLKGLESLVFPTISRQSDALRGIVLLAMYHDKLRLKRSMILNQFSDHVSDLKWCNKEFAELFFFYQGVITKQDLILFPMMNELLSDQLEDLKMRYLKDYPFQLNKKLV